MKTIELLFLAFFLLSGSIVRAQGDSLDLVYQTPTKRALREMGVLRQRKI